METKKTQRQPAASRVRRLKGNGSLYACDPKDGKIEAAGARIRSL